MFLYLSLLLSFQRRLTSTREERTRIVPPFRMLNVFSNRVALSKKKRNANDVPLYYYNIVHQAAFLLVMVLERFLPVQ